MLILFLGAGGTGGYFGGRLAQAGKDVVFLVRPGRQAQLARDGLRITSPFGDARVAVRAVQRAYEDLAGAGFDLALCADVRREMWEKYVFLATLAAMTCLLRASVGEICATRHGRGLMLETFAGCQAVARAEGVELSEQGRRHTEGFLTDPASTLTASMLRDLEKGGRTEADHVLGDMLERAAAHGLRLPLLEAAYAQLQAHERRIAGR
ncbi:MAG: ketopantoate reductase C-terminal domain-containing protein [Pseudomonadota bacterium]|jgi:2-dehydropantoate 2-reductase